jgi:predicted dehydrogenase
MRVVVAGLGVQGHKRRRIAGADFVAAVDPVNEEARYRTIMDVPLADYDALLACIPDEPKIDILTYCIGNGKHVLVEKPLWAKHESEITALEALARRNGVVCYTAYNHRCEYSCGCCSV